MLGYNVELQPSSQQATGAPQTLQAVLAFATLADDNSSSDPENAAGKDASPVFGPPANQVPKSDGAAPVAADDERHIFQPIPVESA